MTTVGGSTQTFNNNGAGFPIQDSVIVQTPQSCYSNGNLTVVAAVSLRRNIHIYFICLRCAGPQNCYNPSEHDRNPEGCKHSWQSNRLSPSSSDQCDSVHGSRCYRRPICPLQWQLLCGISYWVEIWLRKRFLCRYFQGRLLSRSYMLTTRLFST